MIHRVCLVVCFACAAATAQADPGFAATPIARGISLLQGYDCNVIALTGEEGVVLVDTCGTGVANELRLSIARLSDKPVRFVINTHAHTDHTGGDDVFQKLAPVIAHNNVRKWMSTGNEVTGDKPSSSEALPIVTFEGEMTLHVNGEEIRVISLPPGHTDSDVVVLFTNANVVCMGDVYMSPGVSFADRHYGGSSLGLIKALEFVLPRIPADAKIIPGHGIVSSRADVASGLDIQQQMKTLVERAVQTGESLEQLTAKRPFDKWRNSVPQWAASDKSLDGWVRDFYRELTLQPIKQRE
jgi:cyclase